MAIAPSFLDLYTVGRAELIAIRSDLQVLEGDITDAQLHAASAMADACIRDAAQKHRDTFLDGARGDALTQLVDDHYNIQRLGEAAAQVSVQFTRPSSGAAGTIEVGTTVATEFDAAGNEIRFQTTTDLYFSASETGPKSVGAIAVEAGRDGNVAATTITRIIDTVFDTTFTVTNPATAAGGSDEETDEDLRQRARLYPSTLRRGTLAALEYGAKTVAGVTVARAIEGSTGLVTVYVADIDGNSTVQMEYDVLVELENWRCAGTVVQVTGGQTLVVDIDIVLTVTPGTSIASLTPTVQDAVTGRLEKLRSNETLYRTMITHVVIGVDPDNILNVEITDPTADVEPTEAFEIIRAGVITVS